MVLRSAVAMKRQMAHYHENRVPCEETMPQSTRPAVGLQLRVSLLVLIVTMLLLAGFAVWEHTLLRSSEETQLREETQRLADRAGRLLALPLWNLDGPSARAIIQTEMDDPRVFGIALFEQGKQLFEGMQRDSSWRVVPWVGSAPPDAIEARSTLVIEGTQVGSVSVLVSPRFLAARLAERFQQAMWRFALLAAILAVGLVLLVRTVLITPVSLLASVTRRVTREENFALRAPRGADDELGELVDSFNNMLDRIEQRNRLLAEQRRRLEHEVSERTAEYVAAREHAERESKAMSDFLAAITHEVRTPMTGILGLLDISLRGQLDPRLREHLEIVRSSSHALLDVINAVLDFSRIEAGKLRIERIPFTLRDCLEDVMDLFRAQLAQHDIALVLDMAEDLPEKVAGDPTRLRQVLVNLVGNAFKFTEKGEVVLRVAHETQSDGSVLLRFAVRDTGVGIPAEARKRLFEMFSQADVTVARRFGGSGLGLAIARELVRLMGGGIEVDSTPGRGTTFRFTVHCTALSGPAVQPPVLAGRRVVLAEAQPALQRVLCGMLKAWGAHVTVVSDSAGLMDVGEGVDIVVLSSHLYGGLAALARPGKASRPPVLLMAPYGEEPEVSLCDGAGVVGFMGRPVRLAALRVAVGQVLAGEPVRPVPEVDGYGATARPAYPAPSEGTPPPMVQTPAAVDSGEAAPAAAVDPLDGVRVLLAEDDEVSRLVLHEMLAMRGAVVAEARGGEEVLERFVSGIWDVVFLDVQMPGMDGFATLRLLRALPGGADVPVALFTAQHITEEELAARGVHVAGIVEKPVDRAALDAFMQRCLADKPRRQATAGMRATSPSTDTGTGPGPDTVSQVSPAVHGPDGGPTASPASPVEPVVSGGPVGHSPGATAAAEGGMASASGATVTEGAPVAAMPVPAADEVDRTRRPGGEDDTGASPARGDVAGADAGSAGVHSASAGAAGEMPDRVRQSGSGEVPEEAAQAAMPEEMRRSGAPVEVPPAGAPAAPAEAVSLGGQGRRPRKLDGPPLPESLPYMDLPEVLTRVGGKEWLLLKVLRSFVTAYADAADELDALLAKGDFEGLKMRGHALAGAVGNISAHDLRAVCLAIELGGDPATLRTLLASFREELARVVSVIRELLAVYETP